MAKIYYFPKKENSLRWQNTLKLAWDRMYGIHCLLLFQEESLDEVLKVVYTMLFIVYYFPKNHFWVASSLSFCIQSQVVPKDYYKGRFKLEHCQSVERGSHGRVDCLRHGNFPERVHRLWYQLSQWKGVWCVYLFEEPCFWRNPCEVTDSSCWGEETPLQGAASRRGKHLDQPKIKDVFPRTPGNICDVVKESNRVHKFASTLMAFWRKNILGGVKICGGIFTAWNEPNIDIPKVPLITDILERASEKLGGIFTLKMDQILKFLHFVRIRMFEFCHNSSFWVFFLSLFFFGF